MTNKIKKVSKKIFILTGVYLSNFQNNDIKIPFKTEDNLDDLYTTNINEIVKEKSKRYITYIDPNKSKIKLWCCMYDSTQHKFLPVNTDIPCVWCREQFKTHPVGIPIYYHTKNNKNTKRFQTLLKEHNLPSNIEDFFETEEICCSFPCALAYIIENSPRKYKNSTTLLSLLYFKIYGELTEIPKADSWKILKKWGGHLSIEEYRSSFGKIEYIITPNLKRPFMLSTGTFIEEIVK